MSELLKSVRADLLDRRLLPFVALVCVALLAAIGYAALGGSSSSSSRAAAQSAPARPPGVAVAPAPSTAVDQAIAETATGTAVQRAGAARNPFALLPAQRKAEEASNPRSSSVATAASSATSASATGGSSAKRESGPTKTPAKVEKPTPAPPKAETPRPAPHKPTTLYKVSLQFGTITPGQPAPSLPSYRKLTKVTALPSAKNDLIQFLGVTFAKAGASAAFAISGEVILHGSATCLPSAAQCRMIDVQPGKPEQLEAIGANGQPVTYELRVLSISPVHASSAAVRRVLAAEARVGRDVLASGGTLWMAGMRFSSQAGVLVVAPHPADDVLSLRG